MRNFHGYPVDDAAHPERPWWECTSMGRWVRLDGVRCLSGSRPDGHPAWFCSGVGVDIQDLDVESRHAVDALARIDAEHPLEAPVPMGNQTWVLQSGRAAVVVDVVPQTIPGCWMVALGSEPLGARGAGCHAPWPPPGAVLVAGPTQWGGDCQWAPGGER